MTRDRRFSFVAAVLVAGAVWGTAPRAVAGPADTALPAFSDAKPAVSVYYAFGVIKNNNLETDFVCTNIDGQARNIGVQVFDETGALRNALGANSNGEFLNVAPGATVTVGTSGTVILHEDQTLTLNAAGTAANQLRNGSARIIGTSKNISCSAMLVDKLHTILDPAVSSQPPPTMANVPLTKLP
jgi:hypothetical protein